MNAPVTTRVFIPLTIRKPNGRPKIMPPVDMVPDTGGVAPHILKAIAKAWGWRRKLETGAAATLSDIAEAEGVSDRYVGPMLRLAYLSPAVLEKLLVARVSPEVSIKELGMVSELPWAEQEKSTFGVA
jgi:hypothetical protein